MALWRSVIGLKTPGVLALEDPEDSLPRGCPPPTDSSGSHKIVVQFWPALQSISSREQNQKTAATTGEGRLEISKKTEKKRD